MLNCTCLSHCSIAVTRHHDQGNSYKERHVTGGSEVSPLSWREPSAHRQTNGAGEVAEGSTA